MQVVEIVPEQGGPVILILVPLLKGGSLETELHTGRMPYEGRCYIAACEALLEGGRETWHRFFLGGIIRESMAQWTPQTRTLGLPDQEITSSHV